MKLFILLFSYSFMNEFFKDERIKKVMYNKKV